SPSTRYPSAWTTPSPDGVECSKLRADRAYSAVGDLSKFQITSLNFLDGQVLKLWDVTNYTTATATSNGRQGVLWSDKTQCPEFENSFTYAPVDAASAENSVRIKLDDLQIKFEVTAAYVRNQTGWCTLLIAFIVVFFFLAAECSPN
ncbi:uncharacterized protein ACA1_169770, partial [Acanthamoeba castellanii str. Neff]